MRYLGDKSINVTLYLAIIITGTLGLCFAYFIPYIELRIILFLAVAAIGILSVRRDAAHPYIWFIPFYTLYSLSWPSTVLWSYGTDIEYANMAVLIQFFGLVAFMVASPPTLSISSAHQKLLQSDGYERSKNRLSALSVGSKPLLAISAILSLGFIVGAVMADFSSKTDLVRRGDLFFRLQFAFSILLLSGFVFILNRVVNQQNVPLRFWIVLWGWFALGTIVSSERDLVLRMSLTSMVLWHLFVRPVRFRTLIGLGTLAMLGIAALGFQKLSRKQIDVDINLATLHYQTAGGEFSSASANLVVLIKGLESGVIQRMNGQTFVNDFVRVIGGAMMYGDRENRQNAVAWFNRTFFQKTFERGGGRGFTLVGEGYLNFGIKGVVSLFAILGAVVFLIFVRSSKPVVGLLYSLMIPGFVYSLRGDLSTLLSYTVKHFAVPLVVVMLISSIIISVSKKVGSRSERRNRTLKKTAMVG